MMKRWYWSMDEMYTVGKYGETNEKCTDDNVEWCKYSEVEAEIAKKDDEYRIVEMARRQLIIQEQIKDKMIARLRKALENIRDKTLHKQYAIDIAREALEGK